MRGARQALTEPGVVAKMSGPTHFVGIDPGVNGGIAVLDRSARVVWVCRMPATPSELVAKLQLLPKTSVVLVEFVRSRPRMASQSVFTFGRGFGRIEGAIAAAGLASSFVTPKVWQTAMDCRTAGDKNITKERAARLFPLLRVTHAIADALLIAACCRRLEVDRMVLAARAVR